MKSGDWVSLQVTEIERFRPGLVGVLTLADPPKAGARRTLARLVTICDLLLDDSLPWLHPGAKRPPVPVRPSRHEALLDRRAGLALGWLATLRRSVL